MRLDILAMWVITLIGVAVVLFLVFRKIIPALQKSVSKYDADDQARKEYMELRKERKKKGF